MFFSFWGGGDLVNFGEKNWGILNRFGALWTGFFFFLFLPEFKPV